MKDRKKVSFIPFDGESQGVYFELKSATRMSNGQFVIKQIVHYLGSETEATQSPRQWDLSEKEDAAVRNTAAHLGAAIHAGLHGAVDSRKIAIERLPGSRVHGLLARIVTPRFRDRELKEELAGFQSEFVTAVQRGDRRRQLELRVLTPLWMLRTVIGAVLGAAVSAVRGKIGQ